MRHTWKQKIYFKQIVPKTLEYDYFNIKLFNVTYKLIKLKAFTYVLATAMKLSDKHLFIIFLFKSSERNTYK